jgi:hypothetical protein
VNQINDHMKKAFTLLFVISALLVSYVAYTNQGNPPAARTNAPGEGNCTGCHSGSLITSGTVWSNATLTTSTSLGSLQPNTSYTMNLTFADPSSSKYGFQLVALPSGAGASTASIGSLTSGTGSQTQSSGGRSYLNQTSTGTSVINNTKTWTFTYTTPTSFNGNIVFHTVLNATNSNNSSSDDDVYYKAFSATVLPVSWYKLVAERETENTVIINWTTAQEINNDYFVVERSADMKLWEDAGTVKGSGNTTNVQKYTYHDLTSSLSFIYYRIRQVDFDGTTSLSPMLSVPAFAIDKYAKPVIISKNHEITIATSNTSDLVYIKIIHLNGQVALEKSIMPNEPIFLSQLPSGSYIIVAEARGQQAVKKFFIP